jgi:hypothetical protein
MPWEREYRRRREAARRKMWKRKASEWRDKEEEEEEEEEERKGRESLWKWTCKKRERPGHRPMHSLEGETPIVLRTHHHPLHVYSMVGGRGGRGEGGGGHAVRAEKRERATLSYNQKKQENSLPDDTR